MTAKLQLLDYNFDYSCWITWTVKYDCYILIYECLTTNVKTVII